MPTRCQLKTPLSAQPVRSNEIGHQYLGQLSINFLSEAGARRIERPINLLGLWDQYSVKLTGNSTLFSYHEALKGLPLLMIIIKHQMSMMNNFINSIKYANLLKH